MSENIEIFEVAKPEQTTVVGVTTESDGPNSTRGVTVTAITTEGAGFAAGLRVGDVLLTVNDEPCVDAEQTSGLLRAAAGTVRVAVERPKPKGRGLKLFGRH